VHRHGQQVPERAHVGLAGHRVTGDGRDRDRQEELDFEGQRGERHEEAVAGDRRQELRPTLVAAGRGRGGHLHRDRDDDRDRGQDGEARLVAPAPGDQAQLRGDEPERCRTFPGGRQRRHLNR
jgi:hypothetical protein